MRLAILVLIMSVVWSQGVMPSPALEAKENVSRNAKSFVASPRQRPTRREGPLRELNISDMEIREIQRQVERIFPGTLLNISGVTTGCPCENGPLCSDQVWVVAHQVRSTKGLMLSRIEGHWTIGALEQWWLDYDELRQKKAGGSDRRPRKNAVVGFVTTSKGSKHSRIVIPCARGR